MYKPNLPLEDYFCTTAVRINNDCWSLEAVDQQAKQNQVIVWKDYFRDVLFRY